LCSVRVVSNNHNQLQASVVAILLAAVSVDAQPARISVALDQPGHRIAPTLWGIFFEDINNSADGGIYPELVRNRSFEDSEKLDSWKFVPAVGTGSTAAVDESHPLNPFNRRSLRVRMDGSFSLENEGYWGISVLGGEGYTLRLAARATDGFTGPVTVKLLSTTGQALAAGSISALTGSWKYHTLDLTASGSDAKARLQLSAVGKGALFVDMVSLIPRRTWKDHGLRPDLAESLVALRPSFVRFPGGCWVEGDTMDKMYNWKRTIGDVDVRIPLWNIWRYYATHGLGFHEYLLMCEDLGAAPLFCINAGMSHRETIPMDRMDQWVQDALDAIEYANGPTNSVWGARRAASGHPAPFNLKYLEIGNENGGPAYRERWSLFVKAIKDKYPYMQLIANHWQGGYPRTPAPDIVDEHYYETPEAFMKRATQYDNYDRRGPKIFVGEYAVTRNCGLGNLRAAIGEAAFMTGMERNSDVVVMASYAPLFVNLNHRAWNPDLINFDSANWYGLPSYYVQEMFSENRGDVTLPVQVTAPAPEAEPSQGMIGVGTWNTQAEFKDIKVTAPDGKVLFASDFAKGTQGWKMLGEGEWRAQDGTLQQKAEKEFVRAIAGSGDWTDYTLTLKARKLGGREGFLILFHINDNEDRTWWNLGGWGNTQDAVESGGMLDPKPGRIETGRWYDLRLEIKGKHLKCYQDDKLMHDLDYDGPGGISSLYACASKDEHSGDVIIKVVNTSASQLDIQLDLAGATDLRGQGTATVLTSASGKDENSLSEPKKVFPKTEPVTFGGKGLTRWLPGNSVTVLRLQTKAG
jgi:alpha-L-arabinofuranosidase